MKSYKKVQSNTKSYSLSGHKTVPVKERMKSYKSKSSLILEAGAKIYYSSMLSVEHIFIANGLKMRSQCARNGFRWGYVY